MLNSFLKWNHAASMRRCLRSEQMRLAWAEQAGHSLSAYMHRGKVKWLESQITNL